MIVDRYGDEIVVDDLIEHEDWHGIVVSIKDGELEIEEISGKVRRHQAKRAGAPGRWRAIDVELVDA